MNTIGSGERRGTLKTAKKEVVIKFIKPVVFVIALVTTVSLFTLPIAFYYLSGVLAGYDTNTQLIQSDRNTSTNNSTASCNTALSWSVIDTVVGESVTECEPYTGTICLPYLIQWNQCILSGGGDKEKIHVAVNSKKMQDILEEELSGMYSLLASFPECQALAAPLTCHHYFPLMANCQSTAVNDDQPLYTVTQEDCINIRDTICAVPWQLAVNFGLGDRLPDCSSLPHKNSVNQSVGNYSTIATVDTSPINSSNRSSANITCKPDDFILINSTCFPRCDRFEEKSHSDVKSMLIAEISASLCGFIVSILALILSVYNRKIMFKFPSIFFVYFSMDIFVFALVVLILALDRNELMCSSVNLLEVLFKPTMFCTISGVVFQYVFLNMSLWWFLHLCVFFYEIAFPFHAHQMRKMGRTKYLAIALTTLGLLVPIPGIMVSLLSKSHHYRIVRFPPTICVPDDVVWYYSSTLPFTIGIGAGICILIGILWLIHKNRSSSTPHLHQAFTTAEKKIIIVFICFVGFGVFSLIHVSIVTGNADVVTRGLFNYFLCESTGHVPGKCDRGQFERYLYPQMSVVAHIFMGLIPIAILNFIVNWENLRKSISQKIDKLRGKGPPSVHRISNVSTPEFTNDTSFTKTGSFDHTANGTPLTNMFDYNDDLFFETPV